jgi:hypothetical protein
LIVVESDFRELGACRWLSHPIADSDAAADWLEASMDATELPTDLALAELDRVAAAQASGERR